MPRVEPVMMATLPSSSGALIASNPSVSLVGGSTISTGVRASHSEAGGTWAGPCSGGDEVSEEAGDPLQPPVGGQLGHVDTAQRHRSVVRDQAPSVAAQVVMDVDGGRAPEGLAGEL